MFRRARVRRAAFRAPISWVSVPGRVTCRFRFRDRVSTPETEPSTFAFPPPPPPLLPLPFPSLLPWSSPSSSLPSGFGDATAVAINVGVTRVRASLQSRASWERAASSGCHADVAQKAACASSANGRLPKREPKSERGSGRSKLRKQAERACQPRARNVPARLLPTAHG